MSNNDNYNQKKKNKELFKKIIVQFFLWFLIIAFVSTIGVTWNNNNQQNMNIRKIAEVNGKVFTYQPGSTFGYILNGVREQANKSSKGQVDAEAVNNYSIGKSVDVLLNLAMLSDFAKKVGISPSKDTMRAYIEYMAGGRLYSTPQKGLLDYARMEYDNQAISGNNGDIMNAFSPVTIAELYAYFDLVNFTVESEILYIDVTNYITSKLSEQEIAGFYLSNINKYADEVTIEELAVSNKSFAYEIAGYMQTNGWDKGLDMYKSKGIYSNIIQLKNVSGFAKRYVVAMTNKLGSVVPKPQFENSLYHVMRIKSFPELKLLGSEFKKMVINDYVSLNFTNLRARFSADINNCIQSAEQQILIKNDFRQVAAVSGMTFVKTGKTSPINQILRDDKGNKLDLPIFQNDACFDFMFGAAKNSVSSIFKTDSFALIIKPVSKGMNSSIDYDKIDQEIAMRYINFKNIAVSKDWYDILKKNSKYKVFEDEIKKVYKDQQMD